MLPGPSRLEMRTGPNQAIILSSGGRIPSSTLPGPLNSGLSAVRQIQFGNLPPINLSIGTASRDDEMSNAITYLTKLRACFEFRPEIYNSFLDVMKAFKTKSVSTGELVKTVLELLKGYPSLIAGFDQFLPLEYKLEVRDCTDGGVQGLYQVTTYNNGQVLHQHVAKNLELVSNPNAATRSLQMPPTSVAPSATTRSPPEILPPAVNLDQGGLNYVNALDYVNKIKTRFSEDPEKYRSFVLTLHNYRKIESRDAQTDREVYTKVASLFQNEPDLLEEFRQFLPDPCSEPHRSLAPPVEVTTPDLVHRGSSTRRKYRKRTSMQNPSEMVFDMLKCKPEGTSYRVLPSGFVHPKCTGRDRLGDEVLNDTYVACPKYSWVPPAGGRGRACTNSDLIEEQRYELDMILDENRYTINCLDKVEREMLFMSNDELEVFRLDNCLGGRSAVVHMAAVRRIYGSSDQGKFIIDNLKEHPNQVVPLVRRRLIQKRKEWVEAARRFEKKLAKDNMKSK